MDNSSTDNVSSFRNSTCIICTFEIDLSVTILQVIFGICTFFGNIFTLVMILKTRGLKKTLRLSLLNLTVTDFLLGLVFMYHYSVVYFVFENSIECYIRYVSVGILSGSTLTTVMYLSIDRVVAIKFPYAYGTIVNTKTIAGCAVLCWIAPAIVVIGVFPHYSTITECNYVLISNSLTDFVFSLVNLSLIIATIVCHIILYFEALAQIKKITPTFLGNERRKAEIRMHLKATKSTIIIVLPILALSTPMYIMFLYLAIYPASKRNLTTLEVLNGLYNLSAFTSLLNPFIYTWKIDQLRETIKSTVCKTWFKQREKPQNTRAVTSKQREEAKSKVQVMEEIFI